MNSRNIYSNNAGSIVGSDSSQESHNTSSTNSSSFQHKIRAEVFNFFFASQNVSKKQGGKRFVAILILYIAIYWSYIWLPVLSPQDFHYGLWGSWIFTVFNYTTSFSMELLPYEGAIAVASVAMAFIAITIIIALVTLWAVKATSQYIKKIQMALHINAYLVLVLSAPVIFILTSFVDCDYGYSSREVLADFVTHNSTISTSAILTPMLNRFPSMQCYSTNNIILMAITLTFIALYLIMCVVANFLIPNSHPLSFAPMITEGYMFPIGMSIGNCIGILVHYLIPAEYAFVRSIVHLVYGLCMLIIVVKSLPMYRRYENTIVCGIVCARIGTSMGSIISFFVNSSNTSEIGIGMWGLTTGLAVGFGLLGAVSMDIYTRYVIYFIKTRYILTVRTSDRSLEKDATNIYFKLEEDGSLYKMTLYMRFVLMRYARTKIEELEQKYDLVALISFIRGISSQKGFNDIDLLTVSGTLVGYLMSDETHSSYFAQALLKRALKQRPDVYKRFLIHQRLREVELTAADDVKGSRNMLELKSIMLKIEKYITELTSLHRHFWKELMQEIVNYDKAENIVARCSVINYELDSMFNNILSLYYNDKTVLRTYASYLENFKFNKELASEYYTEASSLEEEESKIPLANQRGNRKTKNKIFPDVQESIDVSKRISQAKGLNVGRSVAFENLETASFMSSNMDFNGVENANSDTKREMGFRNALSIPDSHTVHISTFILFIIFAFILLVVGLVIGLQFSKSVTENVTNVIDACSPICALNNILQSVRAFQMKTLYNSTIGPSNIEYSLSSEPYTSLENTKELVAKFKQILINLQQKAYDAKFDGTVYSTYHEVYKEIYMPTVDSETRLYNYTTKINVTVTDVTNTLIKISDQIIGSSSESIVQTLDNYGFMFLYINHEPITDIYDKFCNVFTDSAKTQALNINNIFTIYISVSLATFIICGGFFIIYSRKELVAVKNQIQLIQKNATKNELGKLFHDLGKKVGDEVSIHISRNAFFKPKNAFLLVSAFLIIVVSVSCGIYLDQTLGNSTYSFESYITMEDGFDAMTFLQYVSFTGSEIFGHVSTTLLGSEGLQLIHDNTVAEMEDRLSYITKELRYFWNLCMYGSAVKAYETLVVGMFPETDAMIRGDVNCTIEKLAQNYIGGGKFKNSTYCEMGIDYMVQDVILMIYKMIQDLTGIHTSGKASTAMLSELLSEFFRINYMTKTISLKLVDFSNIFAVKSSEPILNNMIALAIIGFASNIICAVLMFLLLNNHRRSVFAMRGLFNYLSIDTLENNEPLRNYALYHGIGDGILSKLKTRKQNQTGEDAKVRSILNAAVDGVVLCSSSASIDIFNPAAQRMFGNQQEDVVGKYIFTLFAPQHHAEIRKSIEGMKHTVSSNDPKGESFEVECIRKNNTTFPATVNIFVTIFDKKPIITCFVKDITSEKKHNSLLSEEKKNSETLLLNILPAAVATKLKTGASLIAERFPDVTCFFSDMVGFTSLSSKLTPTDLVQMLNSIVMGFDDLMDKYHLEKIKTIGDAYFAAGGLHDLNAQSDHPERVLRFSVDTFAVIRAFNSEHRKGRANEQINIRIGINTGPVVAGVIGRKKFAYDLWGDSINTASRMESNSKPGRIQISRSTYERVHDLEFTFEERKIEVKGKGLTQTYLLNAKHHQSAVLTEEELAVTIVAANPEAYQDGDIELEEDMDAGYIEKPIGLPVGQSMTFGSVSEMSDDPNPRNLPIIPTITTTEAE